MNPLDDQWGVHEQHGDVPLVHGRVYCGYECCNCANTESLLRLAYRATRRMRALRLLRAGERHASDTWARDIEARMRERMAR